MEALKILLLNHNVAFSGGATFYRALQLARGFARGGHSATLMASSPRNVWDFQEQIIDKVRLIISPGILPTRWRYGFDPYEILRRIRRVRGAQYDIVHAFDNRPTVLYPALACQKKGSRLVMDWCDWFGRGGAVEERTNPFLRIPLRYLDTYFEEAFRLHADATTVINSALEERALELGVPREKIMRLPNGADVEHIQVLEKGNARAKLNLPKGTPILGYEGSLFASDADLLLEAFAQVRKSYPEALLILIGNPKVELPPQPDIIRTGFLPTPELNLYLCACDVLCLPLTDTQANRGRWPSKLGDYFAAGRPVAACGVGDVPSTIQETGAGLFSQPLPDDFATKILHLLADPGLQAQLGTNARQAAESQYNWASLTGQVAALYNRLLGESM